MAKKKKRATPPVSEFRRRLWLFSRHLETIAAALSNKPQVEYRREIIQLTDGDEIALDYIPGKSKRPAVVLFHGLEGCSQSRTLRVFADGFSRMGWSIAAPHFRSCGGHMNKLPRAYHAGDHEDIRRFLKYCRGFFPNARSFFAIGVSLGGNALVNHLAQAKKKDLVVRGAATVSVPHNLVESAAAMDSLVFNRAIYARHFLKTLRRKVERKRQKFPALCDAKKLRRIRRIADFDELYTAPIHGFASARDYWEKSSCGKYLAQMRVPALCINALNDPLVPAQTLVSPKSAPNVLFRRPQHGGHGAFIGTPPDWLFCQVRDFFTSLL